MREQYKMAQNNNKISAGIPEYTLASIEKALNSYFNNRHEKRLPDLYWAVIRIKAEDQDRLKVEKIKGNIQDVATNIYTTLTRVSTTFALRNTRNNEEIEAIDKVFMLKHYKDTPLYGPRLDQYEKFIREAKVLSALSQKTKLVPVVYYYGGRDDQTIYMRDITGYNFKKKFDILEGDSMRVLRYIIRRRRYTSFLSENTFKNLRGFDCSLSHLGEIIRDLEERSLVKIISRTNDGFQVVPDLSASNRFNRPKEEGVLVETNSFTRERYDMITSAISSLIEVQNAGNQQIELIRDVLPTPSMEGYVGQDIKSLGNIISADTKGQDSYSRIFRNSHKDTLEEIIGKINKGLFFDGDSDLSKTLLQFNQGDAYPGNIMCRGSSAYIVDFDKANLSFFANDIIDLLSYADVFFGVRDTKYFYDYALDMKLVEDNDSMTNTQRSISDLYKRVIEHAFNGELLKLAKIKRVLTTLGRLSEIVVKAKNIKPESAIDNYDKTRNKYREYLSGLLDDTELGLQLKEAISSKKDIFAVPK